MEEIDSEYDVYAKSLKWQIIENNIIKEKKLEVSREDAENYTIGLLRQQFAQYQQMAPDETQLKETAQNVLANQEEAKRIFDQLYDVKILEYFKSNIKIKEKKISYDDFLKLAKK
jgi:trigger factor